MNESVRKIFDVLLHDEEYTISDFVNVIYDNWNDDNISELVYLLLEDNKNYVIMCLNGILRI
jgi:hypothetical protein